MLTETPWNLDDILDRLEAMPWCERLAVARQVESTLKTTAATGRVLELVDLLAADNRPRDLPLFSAAR